MDLESAYLSTTRRGRSVSGRRDELVLTGEGVHLVFAAEPAPDPLALVGPVWRLEAVGAGGDAVASPIGGTEVRSNSEKTDQPPAAGAAIRSPAPTRSMANRSASAPWPARG
jgi:hypothetical protein